MAAGKAKTKSTNTSLFKEKSKVSRPGVHAKTKTWRSQKYLDQVFTLKLRLQNQKIPRTIRNVIEVKVN